MTREGRVTKKNEWFAVDRIGLRNTVRRRGVAFVGYELYQNAADEDGTTAITMTLTPPKRGMSTLTIQDDSPEGFRDMADAYTMFADSYKKGNPEKRGAFNIGEKLVLALCEQAMIQSTKGTVYFNADGTRTLGRKTEKTNEGTIFIATLRLTESDYADFCDGMKQLIPTKPTFFNDEEIPQRTPIKILTTTLPTMIGDSDGVMRRTARQTEVRVYEPLEGETAMLYEMGIPVVETGDRWHVDVQQKVLLNVERDNVTPAYLRDVRVAVLNAMAQHLIQDDVAATWVHDALADERVVAPTVNKVLDLQFGEKRVTENPFDPEANHNAASEGYTVIPARTFNKDVWGNVRRFGASLSSSVVTPAPKPFKEGGKPLKLQKEINPAMRRFERFAQELAKVVLGHSVSVTFANDSGWHFGGCYGGTAGKVFVGDSEGNLTMLGALAGRGSLTVNVASYGYAWFDGGDWPSRVSGWVDFLTHEYAHENVSDHLSKEYYNACTKLAGKIVEACLVHPDIFKE